MVSAVPELDNPSDDILTPYWPTVAIGAGPANLSLAALYQEASVDHFALFEKSRSPQWHDGMLYSGVRMQTSWIKDLVSLVAPSNRLSFLNYLVENGRVFHFLSAQLDSIPRQEYRRYLEWAARRIDNIHYGVTIDDIHLVGDRFVLHAQGTPVASSTNLVFGMGNAPKVPECLAGLRPPSAVVADELLDHLHRFDDPVAPVAVVGSGQTAAEAVILLARNGFTNLHWIGRRQWFAPLDDSASANELFRPAYEDYLFSLPAGTRRDLVTEQNLASNGISMETIREIFTLNYESELEAGHMPVTMYPDHCVVKSEPTTHGTVRLTCAAVGGERSVDARHVVVGAGRVAPPLPFSPQLRDMVEFDEWGEPVLERDYSIRWAGAGHNKMFALNRGRYSHGLADSNLSLMAVRSALVVNSLLGKEQYPVRDAIVGTSWA